jgi:hypothetical protein
MCHYHYSGHNIINIVLSHSLAFQDKKHYYALFKTVLLIYWALSN